MNETRESAKATRQGRNVSRAHERERTDRRAGGAQSDHGAARPGGRVQALYLSGGSLGWLKCVTEANLTLPELAAVALDMRAVCQLPIILDAGGGWGDPVHVHRTIALAEAAGFAAIEWILLWDRAARIRK